MVGHVLHFTSRSLLLMSDLSLALPFDFKACRPKQSSFWPSWKIKYSLHTFNIAHVLVDVLCTLAAACNKITPTWSHVIRYFSKPVWNLNNFFFTCGHAVISLPGCSMQCLPKPKLKFGFSAFNKTFKRLFVSWIDNRDHKAQWYLLILYYYILHTLNIKSSVFSVRQCLQSALPVVLAASCSLRGFHQVCDIGRPIGLI